MSAFFAPLSRARRRRAARGSGCALALAVALFAAAASAQEIKGRVLVLVDTSGSMVAHFTDNNSTGGDGNTSSRFTDALQKNKNYYPGAALKGGGFDGVNSRLYAAKSALTNAVNGVADLDFGLMRYAPAVGNGLPCANATNCCAFNNPECTVYNGYVDNGGKLTWLGLCGTTTQSGNPPVTISTDGGQILVTPGAGSNPQVAQWVDGVEVFTDRGDGWPTNGELRANGTTPLAGSARTALNKWYQPILSYTRANPGCDPKTSALCDPQIDCRPYVLVLATDGADTCDTDTTNGPVKAVAQLTAANPKNPVKTYVIGLAFFQNDPAIPVLNNMAAAGGTTSARFANNQASIEAAFGDIAASSVKVELCNNVDDNCNGLIDEGFDKGAACGVGVGACARSGITKCDPNNDTQTACCVNDGNPTTCVPLAAGTPGPLLCDGVSDNNCNGVVDSNEPGCAGLVAMPEVCDGVDNDRDGKIDDNLTDVGLPCGLDIGVCKPGVTACLNSMGGDIAKMGVTADAGDHLACVGGVAPSPEVCNGLDDDCDGVVDGMTQSCFDGPMGDAGVGVCQAGSQRCTATLGSGVAAWGPCVGEVLPRKEICNGLDDDCDGKVDDVTGAGASCCPSGKCGVGACTAGTMQCSGGALACTGGVGPEPEVCNGKDDDCDGLVDDLPSLGKPCVAMNGCAGTLACDVPKMDVACVTTQMNCQVVSCNDPRIGQPCGPGVGLPGPCMAGTWTCANDVVSCAGGVGPSPEACNCKDDDCNGKVDDNAYCPPGTTCVDCGCFAPCGGGEFPCPGGYYCDGDNYCKPEKTCDPPCKDTEVCDTEKGVCNDVCAGVSCGATYTCVRGLCVGDSCVEGKVTCGTCQKCDTAARACVADLCCNVRCAAGQFCQPATGQCQTPCTAVQCGAGELCVAGACRADPCAQVSCNEGQACDSTSGQCVADPCRQKSCIAPLVCVKGACVQDQCAEVQCPTGTRCVTDRLTGDQSCVSAVPVAEQDRVVGAGGGGFGCAVVRSGRPGGRGSLGFMVLVALGLVAARRRWRGVGA